MTPLAASYREEPFWWREAPPASGPAASLPTDVDVVIVGGGYTGMMAATRLAWRGRSVAVLEKETFGWGASGRNGGMVHPGFKVDPGTLLSRWGEQGRRLYRASLDAFALVEETIERYGIRCEYARTGHLYLAYRPDHVPHLAAEAELVDREFGIKATMMSQEALQGEVGSTAYHGGMLFERSGGLHPAKYLAGLVRVARDAGAHLYDHLPATRVEGTARGFDVETPQGLIRCREVLLATNGYTDSLLPRLRRRVIPVGSYIIATEPLPEDLAHGLIPNRRMLFDSKNFLYYWRLSPDGRRMLFGGRASFAPTSIPKARDWLYEAMTRVHPQLAGVAVEHAWGGQLGFTFDRMPHIGRIGGITYALGYCGTGVAMSTYFGQLAADWIAGEELPSCWRRPLRGAPLYRERPWFLPAVGLYYQLRDRF
ncbi:MAG: FAD-binding oxidoreductase [Candidatus Dormibacteraeota bacterium]|nr:FAD-binding oxidoreductase [Candidatus Dormibacteraeota bacterium]